MTDKDIVFLSLMKTQERVIGFNPYMSVETFKAEILFNHEFAKAFWGEQEHDYIDNGITEECKYCTAYIEEYEEAIGEFCWQDHLSNMVLEEKPLKYLEKFLEEK